MALTQPITKEIIRDFVKANPNKKNIRSAILTYTYFNRGADETGEFENPDEVRPGCVFGHIIASLGGGPEDVSEGRSITDINPTIIDPEIRLECREMQSRADNNRLPWEQTYGFAFGPLDEGE